jgi:hypothetical protein
MADALSRSMSLTVPVDGRPAVMKTDFRKMNLKPRAATVLGYTGPGTATGGATATRR